MDAPTPPVTDAPNARIGEKGSKDPAEDKGKPTETWAAHLPKATVHHENGRMAPFSPVSVGSSNQDPRTSRGPSSTGRTENRYNGKHLRTFSHDDEPDHTEVGIEPTMRSRPSKSPVKASSVAGFSTHSGLSPTNTYGMKRRRSFSPPPNRAAVPSFKFARPTMPGYGNAGRRGSSFSGGAGTVRGGTAYRGIGRGAGRGYWRPNLSTGIPAQRAGRSMRDTPQTTGITPVSMAGMPLRPSSRMYSNGNMGGTSSGGNRRGGRFG